MRNVIAAAITIVVYWIKITLDKHAKEIKSTLININNNLSVTHTVNIYNPTQVSPSITMEPTVDEEES